MNQTVNILGNFRKGAKGQDSDNLGLDVVAHLKVFDSLNPGAVLFLFVSQGHFVLFFVESFDIDLKLLAHGYDFGRMLDSVPGKLGYVNQTVNAADIDKSAERCYGFNDTGIGLANLRLLPELSSLLLFELFHKGNSVLGLVELFDINFYLIAHRHNLGRMCDADGGKFGYMNQTVNAAQIHKCAERCEGLDGTGVLLAHFGICPELFCGFVCFFLSNGFYGADNSLSASPVRIHLDDSEPLLRVEQHAQIRKIVDCTLRRGNKYAHTVGYGDYAAPNQFHNSACQDFSVVECVFQLLQSLNCVNLLLRQGDNSVSVAHMNDVDINFFTDFDQIGRDRSRIRRQLIQRDNTVVFASDINLYLCGGDTDYHALDNLSGF